MTADPDLPTYDAAAAAGYLGEILGQGTADGDAFVLARYRAAPPELQTLVEAQLDVVTIFTRAANRDDPRAAYDLRFCCVIVPGPRPKCWRCATG